MLNASKPLAKAAFVTLVLALPLTAQSAAAATCSNKPIYASGKGLTINRAMARAKKNWQRATELRRGLLWSRWSWAKRKSRKCAKRGFRWHCKVKAYPCKAL